LLANIGDDLPAPADGLLTTVAWQREKGGPLTYAREGSIFSAGSAVQWLRDGLGIIDHASDLEGLAQSVPDTGDVFLVPAFTGLGSPWWDPWARGTLVGLTRGTGRAEMARAVVEAMVFQTRDVVDAMSREGLTIADLRIDGGAAVMELLLDLQADQLNIPVTRSATTEATALGAAWLAGLAEGVWDSLDELSDLWQADRTALPAADRSKVNVLHHRWLQAVDRSRQWEQPPQ
jgi:glycerol kinase